MYDLVPAFPQTQTSRPPMLTIEHWVGNTPLVRLQRLTRHLPHSIEIHAKLEWFNAGGSIKARPALNIIRQAEANGLLHSGKTLLDATSGNMGIAYATFAAARGYRVQLCIPENASPERIKLLRALGAELVLTDPLEGSDGAIEKARELVAANPDRYFYADQYNNPNNWQAHYVSTGPEIWRQTNGHITHFVGGLGTSGTLMGTGRYLRTQKPSVQIVSLQPDLPYHGLEGLKHMPTAIVPGIYDPSLADENIGVSTEAALHITRRLAREEGLFTGISAGAAVCGALQVARELAMQGLPATIVTILPDAGYKYLSDRFWSE
ncbi:MAG TPA: cysteine synthase [Anaerolineales bacterium]|nr:cysteine synthase [Anaerolineales bacterium]